MTGIRDRLTRLHPAWALLLIVISFGIAGFAFSIEAYQVHLASTLLTGLLPLLWAHGVLDRSTSGPDRPVLPWVAKLFAATELAFVGFAVVVTVIGFDRVVVILGAFFPLAIIAYFICLWMSAAALSRAEGHGRAAGGATLGTFLLMVYWPVGIWFIQPRLKRLDAGIRSA